MDSYLPLPEAARITHVSEMQLKSLALIGKIKSVMLHNEILLNESDLMAFKPKTLFEHLRGQAIGIGEAARKYDLHQQTISRWKDKGFIQVIRQEGQKIFVDEMDVAFMATNYKQNPGKGRWTSRKIQN